MTQDLKSVAGQLVVQNKGILAADESTGTIRKRFEKVGVESTEENRRRYRELLFSAKDIEKFISGVIMYDETIRQSTSEGKKFPELLSERGILPGIKVDKGVVNMPRFPGEKITEGLDGLSERLAEYKTLGAKFAKWRAVITIGQNMPSQVCIDSNSECLARYGAACQEVGIVPIIEPEVLMDGSHDMQRSKEITTLTLKTVFLYLAKHKVDFSGMLLKPSMVHPGAESGEQKTAPEIATATIEILKETVPAEVPGVVFLSGGQSPHEAEDNLRAMNKNGEVPWELTFSYGRALQDEALKVWGGKDENKTNAQEVFYKTAQRDSMAREGK